MRILVQTLTHLDPQSEDASLRISSVVNRIFMHQWGCLFDPKTSNYNFEGCEIGYHNRPCFFLVDHREHPNGRGGHPSLIRMQVGSRL